jgi:NADH-quinone oxidoreductase subunit N
MDTTTWASMQPAIPEISLAAAVCALLMIDVFAGARRGLTATVSLLFLAGCAALTFVYGHVETRTLLFGGLYVADPLAVWLKLCAFLTVGLGLFYGEAYMERRGIKGGEYYVLALTSLLGICVLASANSLLTVYIGVELLSLSLYALVAFDRDNGVAAEAAIKYFVLGAIASGVMLYGMSLLYGLTGTLDLDHLSVAALGPSTASGAGIVIAVAFIVVAVAFKFGAVPFHMWVPDVYSGAPASVTLLLATAPKLGSFALATRLLTHGLQSDPQAWTQMVTVVAVLSLVLGNVVAIAQTSIRRMLAYSAIANVGFLLLGFVPASNSAYASALNYTLIYILTALGSFGCVLLAARVSGEAEELDDYKGLAARDPRLAALLAITMLSTAGIPPFAGFWAKLWVIQALLSGKLLWLALLAMFTSVIGAYYYLRVIWFMYFEPGTDVSGIERQPLLRGVLALNCLALLALGILPGALLKLCTSLMG